MLRAVLGEVSARAALDEVLPRMAPETESLIDEILPLLALLSRLTGRSNRLTGIQRSSSAARGPRNP